MPRPLKVFRAHLGFYDSIIAAPSQKSALAAWGVHPNQFRQGFAAVTKDPNAVKSALARPGIVLQRPYESGGEFKTQPELPKTPKSNAKQKRAVNKALRQRNERKAAERRAAKRAEELRAKAAERELEDIEREEKKLRQRRQALQKKFRPHSV